MAHAHFVGWSAPTQDEVEGDRSGRDKKGLRRHKMLMVARLRITKGGEGASKASGSSVGRFGQWITQPLRAQSPAMALMS